MIGKRITTGVQDILAYSQNPHFFIIFLSIFPIICYSSSFFTRRFKSIAKEALDQTPIVGMVDIVVYFWMANWLGCKVAIVGCKLGCERIAMGSQSDLISIVISFFFFFCYHSFKLCIEVDLKVVLDVG